ncbi:MAG: ubiE/COQ5 methyltransferase family-domain-containing protein [Monoraphidium minutum]|nr:MAG: ubiE/COQ5 methyltransferase family-domain-containing protein [Monoraphidium minutum]
MQHLIQQRMTLRSGSSSAGRRERRPAEAVQRAQRRRASPLFAARTDLQPAAAAAPQASQPSTSGRPDTGGVPGPRGAFEPGQESAARQQLFNRIAPVYDELNERLSFGQHRVWKRMAVRWARAAPGGTALDVCCGSGDLAFELAAAVGPAGQVVGLDFAAEMLSDAEARRAAADAARPASRLSPRMRWVQGDALELPFPDNSFDAATMGYGLRNVADIPRALAELRRVLRPGCSAAVLDFNNSEDPLVDGAQAFFLERLVVPAAASYGLAAEYEYLRPSIKRFPTGRQQEAMAAAAGFSSARHYDVGFGLMGCLVATK